jgi:hypothetical protein
MLEEPMLFFESSILCNNVDIQNGWAQCSSEQTVFTRGKDNQVICFLNLKDLKGIHSVIWKWYEPSRRLSRLTRKIPLGDKEKIYEKYIAWDKINISNEKKLGIWSVAIFLDDEILTAREFEIR